jgi:hypothetical protein
MESVNNRGEYFKLINIINTQLLNRELQNDFIWADASVQFHNETVAEMRRVTQSISNEEKSSIILFDPTGHSLYAATHEGNLDFMNFYHFDFPQACSRTFPA